MLIRRARESSGLTRTEVGAAIGRTEQSIVSYELGRATPPPEILSRIAEVVGAHPGDFFDEPVRSDA